MADLLQHLAHLVLAALVNHDAQPDARAGLAQDGDLSRTGVPPSDQKPAPAQPVERSRRRLAINKGVIFFVQPVARVHDPVRQFTIIRQQ